MSAMTYVQEELSDARMRCDQLLRYVDRAVKLVEKSSHKDHFFEVAGDLIRGIPETVFKLHKALEAVALAANRIDYEEIKQDLRPEKVEELERVLKDVRVRQVQRRSLPMVNPPDAVQQLKNLAKNARETGQLETAALGTLIASLEAGAAPKVGNGDGVAAQLDAMAHALENPPKGELPSRHRLAQVLRRVYADHVDVTAERVYDDDPTFEIGLAAAAMKQLMRGPGSPQRTRALLQSMLRNLGDWATKLGQPDTIFKAFQRAADVVQHNWSGHAVPLEPLPPNPLFPADPDARNASAEDAKRSRFEEGKPADPTKNMDPEDAKAWKENTEEYGDKFKKEAAKPSDAAQLAINTSIMGLRQLLRGAGSPKRTLHGVVTSLAEAAQSMGQDGRITLALQKAAMAINQAFSTADMRDYAEGPAAVTAAEDAKRSRFEEGKPADPTKNMDPEDAKAWKSNTDKYEDKFKKEAAGNIPPPDQNVIDEIMSWHGGQGSKLYSVGSRWNSGHPVSADDAEEVFDELESKHADHNALADFEQHLMEHGVTPTSVQPRIDKMKKRELKEMEGLLKAQGFNPKDAKKLQDEGMGPEELKTRLKRPAGAVGSLEYTHNLQRKTKKASEGAAFWKAE